MCASHPKPSDLTIVAEVAVAVVRSTYAEELALGKTVCTPMEADRVLNARLLIGQVDTALRRPVFATWRVCKSNRMVRIALRLGWCIFRIRTVAMEFHRVYWIPPFQILEAEGWKSIWSPKRF